MLTKREWVFSPALKRIKVWRQGLSGQDKHLLAKKILTVPEWDRARRL